MMARAFPAGLRPGRCPHDHLRRQLARALPAEVDLGPSTLRPWASANFVGARHAFPCMLATDGLDDVSRQQWRDQLEATEWRLSGHIVADVSIEASPTGVQIEVLTVED